jgi:hypothetical protein
LGLAPQTDIAALGKSISVQKGTLIDLDRNLPYAIQSTILALSFSHLIERAEHNPAGPA